MSWANLDENCPEKGVCRLMRRCISKDPNRRPTMTMVFNELNERLEKVREGVFCVDTTHFKDLSSGREM